MIKSQNYGSASNKKSKTTHFTKANDDEHPAISNLLIIVHFHPLRAPKAFSLHFAPNIKFSEHQTRTARFVKNTDSQRGHPGNLVRSLDETAVII